MSRANKLRLAGALGGQVNGVFGGGGGLIGGLTFEKVPVKWLKVLFGLFLLYGGVRYLT